MPALTRRPPFPRQRPWSPLPERAQAHPDRRRLEIVPAGGVPLPLLEAIGAAVDAALGTTHHVAPPLDVPAQWLAGDAIRSGAVIDALLARAEAAGEIGAAPLTLVVADRPLVAPDGKTVFGEAAVGGGCAVIGTGALDGARHCDAKALADRARKAAVHEAAHAIGLEHCADPTCVMYPARHIADVDRKAIGFCARCMGDLAHATLDAARG